MHDFSCTQAEDMNYQILANRVRYFKETEEGREIMCKAIEDLANERAKKTTLDHVQKMMSALELTLEKAMDILQLSPDEREYVITNIKAA